MPAKFDLIESPPIPSEQIRQQIDRILRSGAFRGSEILRHLLEYFASCSFEGRTESVKVKEIAKAVFGRSDNFDSQSDSVVRVHTGRLRSKLAEYYIDEGSEDELIISIPKGSYLLAWHTRHAVPAQSGASLSAALPELSAEVLPAALSHSAATLHRVSRLLIWSLLLVVLSSAMTLMVSRFIVSRRQLSDERSGPALRTFWQPFVAGKENPLIVFSNFRLVGSLETSMRAYSGNVDVPPQQVIDTYTTVGEVMGVFDVTRTLGALGRPARAKHGQLLTWDDAKDTNLIFVGGPLADTPLRAMPAMRDLQFSKSILGPPSESGAIVNKHPGRGEQAIYLGPTARPFGFDYAVIASKPAFNRNRRALILAGITEYGTQGAAEFVTREDHVNELLSRLNVKPGDPVPPFEALLRVKIEGGVPVQYELVLARVVN